MPRTGTIAYGLSWDHDKKGRLAALLFAFAVLAAMLLAVTPDAGAAEPAVSVIVTVRPGAGDDAMDFAEELGGTVTARLDIIGGFAADVPGDMIGRLGAHPDVMAMTADATVALQSADGADWAADTATYKNSGSMWKTTRFIFANEMWAAGYTGAGIDVALIDSGVVPVEGLDLPGKVINGPDLSFESQAPNLRYLDTYGHGTHLAGIIAGADAGIVDPYLDGRTKFVGVAPDARLVNIKVADSQGAVDVSQVIAAIDWVVQHRNDNGMNIRVLNLSFGTDSVQASQLDPLSYAVEQAWKAGIVVVVAAGNDGTASDMRMPAKNPYVIAVGAYDTNGTNINGDDFITDFTSCGTSSRDVDLVAPGRSIMSLRAPGSYADTNHPEARIDDRLFKGSGTSQAAAVVSGAVALILQQRPELTPDQVKELLTANTVYTTASGECDRKTKLELRKAMAAATPSVAAARQSHTPATGLGTLEAARGSNHVGHNGVVLIGEQDIHGRPWNGASWSTAAAAGASWSAGSWNGASWSGASWSGASWSGASWSGASWSGASWSGASWSSVSWSGASWSGASWSGASWSGASWSGASWSGASWSGMVW